ncbi:hypothetical protein SNEBB_007536 [Seison nebaliae]|nr:hypothetical protein SNEBB_007536 [Seison nebaliae]
MTIDHLNYKSDKFLLLPSESFDNCDNGNELSLFVAEFAEREGPKAALNIVGDLKDVNVNKLCIAILDVDYHSNLTNDWKFGILLYLVLYDEFARGFIRPFVIVLLCQNYQFLKENFVPLFNHMEKFGKKLKKINLQSFAKDVEILSEMNKKRLKLLRNDKECTRRNNHYNDMRKKISVARNRSQSLPLISDKSALDRIERKSSSQWTIAGPLNALPIHTMMKHGSRLKEFDQDLRELHLLCEMDIVELQHHFIKLFNQVSAFRT